ncbi:hypothetical protein Sango_2633800 [Sesamum angolense]|uniref:Uncharacterized protein n=1 Tax=Sesamum angolense TaxID=2727404 RepID=A0AAE2BGP4_9LAMI|nr:hypothetical protein Sango_2633800 [Sesamum angolense]
MDEIWDQNRGGEKRKGGHPCSTPFYFNSGNVSGRGGSLRRPPSASVSAFFGCFLTATNAEQTTSLRDCKKPVKKGRYWGRSMSAFLLSAQKSCRFMLLTSYFYRTANVLAHTLAHRLLAVRKPNNLTRPLWTSFVKKNRLRGCLGFM